MKRLLRSALVILLLAPVMNCQSAGAKESPARELLELALAAAEKGGDPLVIALEENARPQVRRVAASLRATVELKDVISDEYLLPRGHVQVPTLDIDGNKAVIVLLLGPVPRPTGEPSLACGDSWAFEFARDENGEWLQGPTAVSTC